MSSPSLIFVSIILGDKYKLWISLLCNTTCRTFWLQFQKFRTKLFIENHRWTDNLLPHKGQIPFFPSFWNSYEIPWHLWCWFYSVTKSFYMHKNFHYELAGKWQLVDICDMATFTLASFFFGHNGHNRTIKKNSWLSSLRSSDDLHTMLKFTPFITMESSATRHLVFPNVTKMLQIHEGHWPGDPFSEGPWINSVLLIIPRFIFSSATHGTLEHCLANALILFTQNIYRSFVSVVKADWYELQGRATERYWSNTRSSVSWRRTD
jgi:hypothetical protein